MIHVIGLVDSRRLDAFLAPCLLAMLPKINPTDHVLFLTEKELDRLPKPERPTNTNPASGLIVVSFGVELDWHALKDHFMGQVTYYEDWSNVRVRPIPKWVDFVNLAKVSDDLTGVVHNLCSGKAPEYIRYLRRFECPLPEKLLAISKMFEMLSSNVKEKQCPLSM